MLFLTFVSTVDTHVIEVNGTKKKKFRLQTAPNTQCQTGVFFSTAEILNIVISGRWLWREHRSLAHLMFQACWLGGTANQEKGLS